MHIQLKKYNILMLVVLSLIISSTALSQENESKSEQWRTPASSNMVYMQLEGGKVIIELAPFIAPKQVRRFVDRINEGFYDNTEFYRVIDGFVAQGGDVSETKESKYSSPLKAEFTR
jgi:peptidylprolyl isomerase